MLSFYSKHLMGCQSIQDKLDCLTHIRTEEGYMAGWKKEGNHYLFYENHCPICTVVQQCQQFCQSELNILQQLFGSFAKIERTEFLMDDDRRCSYRITPLI